MSQPPEDMVPPITGELLWNPSSLDQQGILDVVNVRLMTLFLENMLSVISQT